MKSAAIAAYLPDSGVGPDPQELAPFLQIRFGLKGGCPGF
jgi:hypothetical protein